MSDHYTHELGQELRKSLQETGKAAASDLNPPEVAHDGRNVGHQRMIQIVREQSYRDPTYLEQMLERLAPRGATLPDGTKLRSETGLKNFHDLVKEARPDVYVAVVLAQHTPGQEPITLTELKAQQEQAQQQALMAQQQAQAQPQPMQQPMPAPAPGGF